MARKRRQPPKYQRDAERAAKEAAAAAAAQQHADRRAFAIFADRVAQMLAANQAKERARMDPQEFIHVVRPFGVSREQGLNTNDVARLHELKLAALGYDACTFLEWDDDRCHVSEGPPGAVASLADAEKLVAVLAQAFPGVRFRIEPTNTHRSCVDWRSLDEVLADNQAG